MKSETMLLSLEWRLGRRRFFLTSKLLGYDTIEVIENDIPRKKLVINEEQAQTSTHVLQCCSTEAAPQRARKIFGGRSSFCAKRWSISCS